jgi:hypothetical protein
LKKKEKNKTKPSHPSFQPKQPTLHLFFSFSPARPNLSSRPTYPSSRPAYPPSLTLSLTGGTHPSGSPLTSSRPPLSHGRAGRSVPGALSPSRAARALQWSRASALHSTDAVPASSSPRNGRHRAVHHQWRSPERRHPTASAAPPPLLSHPYIRSPELPL